MSLESAILSQLRCLNAAVCKTAVAEGGATEATQLLILNSIDSLVENSTSKIGRISGAANYSRTLTYHGTGTENVITILHTGTTLIGVESIIETISYANPAINGSNITSIVYS